VNVYNKKVISVSEKKDVEAQRVHALNRLGGNDASQRWRVIYTDNMGGEAYRKKGQMSKDSGIRVDEPFYLRSKLPMQRVAECVGANNVTLKKWYKNRKA